MNKKTAYRIFNCLKTKFTKNRKKKQMSTCKRIKMV